MDLRLVADEVRVGVDAGSDVSGMRGSRKHVFAQIKPATQKRIDMGFALKDTRTTGRLIDTGGLAKGDRITHKIHITQASDIDAEVLSWFKTAYSLDA